jgi:hypothetical protein
MGFKSALTRNQATEDAITTEDAALGRYTTMAVSHIHLRLDSWYQELSYAQRVARMYSPQTTPADVAKFITDAESNPALIYQAIRKHGVVGHAQAVATARFQGKPLILRRDFDTVDGGQAGVHFVSLQRAISDFVRTRNAMNQTAAPVENRAITATVNNGINEFMSVIRRGNYLIPSRAARSFPLLPGRTAALEST